MVQTSVYPPVEVTCGNGHTFPTTGKPGGNTDCPRCREAGKRGYAHIPVNRPRTQSEAARVQRSRTLTGDPGDTVWNDQKPFDTDTVLKLSGVCGNCRQPVNEFTARGTYILCRNCQCMTREAKTWDRAELTLARNAKHAKRIAGERKAEANAKRKARELTTNERTALAEAVAIMRKAIAGTIVKLNPDDALNSASAQRAAGMIGRLQEIDRLITDEIRRPTVDSEQTLIRLTETLVAERERYGPIIAELDNARNARKANERALTMRPEPEPLAIAAPPKYFQRPDDYEDVDYEDVDYEEAPAPALQSGRICDISSHREPVTAWHYVLMGHRPIKQYQQRDVIQIDLCDAHFSQFDAAPDRLLKAHGYEYAHAGELTPQ